MLLYIQLGYVRFILCRHSQIGCPMENIGGEEEQKVPGESTEEGVLRRVLTKSRSLRTPGSFGASRLLGSDLHCPPVYPPNE